MSRKVRSKRRMKVETESFGFIDIVILVFFFGRRSDWSEKRSSLNEEEGS